MKRRVTFPLLTVLIVVTILFTPPLAGFAVPSSAKRTSPRAHMIPGVPWHPQLNGLSCGAASLGIVFDYWGPSIDEKEIMNVARSSSIGTWAADIVRTGHFSYMSDAQGRFFPSIGPDGGFEERRLGYAAFSYTAEACWIDELKALIAQDIPVIVLMKYYPEDGSGHYRVVIGYDDDRELIYFSDPWGRDLNHLTGWTGVIHWSYADFETGWNYAEYGAGNPYFGAAIMPWSIEATVKGSTTQGSVLTVTAAIEYPCLRPFDDGQPPATEAMAQISLPDGTGMTLLSDSPTIALGTVHVGDHATVSWRVLCNEDAAGKSISVSAWGVVSGSVPEARWQGQSVAYPEYSYVDAIGGETSVQLGPR